MWRTVGVGFVAGTAAFLLGVLLTRLLYWSGPPILVFPGMGVGPWRLSTWFYLNAHRVTLAASHSLVDQFLGPGPGYELLTRDGSSLYRGVLAFPPIALTAAGFATGAATGPHRSAWLSPASGSFIVVGYLPSAVIAALASTMIDPTLLPATRIGPELASTVIYAGLAYPVGFGLLGGGLAGGLTILRPSRGDRGSR